MKKKILETKFLILTEIARSQPHIKQINIAEKLDLTPQAVSDHIKELKNQNLIESDSNKLFVTKEGIQYIINSLDEIKNYLDKINDEIIRKAPSKALATEKLDEGEKVNLFMKNGVLRASKSHGKGKARGKTLNSAEKNEEVKVSNIKGIIDIKKGVANILSVPPPEEGGSSSLEKPDLSEINYDKIYTIGIGAISFTKKIDLKPDFSFPTIDSVINSLFRGINCLIIVDEEREKELLENLNEKGIDFNLIKN